MVDTLHPAQPREESAWTGPSQALPAGEPGIWGLQKQVGLPSFILKRLNPGV